MVSATRAKAGEEVSFRVPGGDAIESIVIRTETGAVTYSENDGGYSFEMPAADVTIDVVYSQGGGCSGSLSGTAGIVTASAAIGLICLSVIWWKKQKRSASGRK